MCQRVTARWQSKGLYKNIEDKVCRKIVALLEQNYEGAIFGLMKWSEVVQVERLY